MFYFCSEVKAATRRRFVMPETRSELEIQAMQALVTIAAEIGAIRKEVAGIRAAVVGLGPQLASIGQSATAIAHKK
jgi:hypothetical protein